MTIVRAQVRIPMDTNVGADAVINTFHFDVDDASTLGIVDPTTALMAFYNGWQNYRSSLGTWNLSTIKWYNLEEDEPRAPFSEANFSMSTTVGTNVLPPEVAVCVSYQAIESSGFPQARRRGRIFCGPVSGDCLSTSTGLIASAAVTAFATAANGLRAASVAATSWNWGVLSQASGSLVFAGVNNGWVDNAPDIQRRRGVLATTRTTFS